jgi:large subunit ribosomal protein L22
MEAVAKLNNCNIAPRKMRLVIDIIRGKSVFDALNILRFTRKVGAPLIEKLLLSAVANWEAKNPDSSIEDADLYVKTVFVSQGRTLKRFQPAPQGRAYRIRKRSSHITLYVDGSFVGIPLADEEVVEAAQVIEDKPTEA